MSSSNFSNKDPKSHDIEIEKPDFDIYFQAALLKLCLAEDYFCSQMVRYLSEDKELQEFAIFDSAEFHYIFTAIAENMSKYKTRCSYEQLRQEICSFAEDEREPYFKALEMIQAADIHNEAYYRKYIATFVTTVKMANGYVKSKSIFKDHPLDAPAHMQKVLDGINRIAFEKEDIVTIDQVYALAEKDGSSHSKIPTGLTRLDEDMRGGFPRETLVTVLGSSNAGKSIFCTSLGCSALRAGFKVLHLNLEGTRSEVAYRYVSNLANVPFRNIEESKLSVGERNKVDEVLAKYKDQILIRNMLNFGVTIQDVIAYCREVHKKFPFDMLVVDYGQLLKTKEKVDKGFDRQTEAYRGLDSISKEFKCVVISPAQSTRDGMKKQRDDFGGHNRNKSAKLPVLRSEDLADCIEIARVSAIIITLNRSEEEEHRGWLRVFLEKQRRGQKAITYGVKANYPCSNLIVNDYYDANSLVHKMEGKDEEEFPAKNLGDMMAETKKNSQAQAPSANIKKEEQKTINKKPEPTPVSSSPVNSNPATTTPKPVVEVKKDIAISSANSADEMTYNSLIPEFEAVDAACKELTRRFNNDELKDEELDQFEEKNRELKQRRKEIREKAKELLPKIIPNASLEQYKLIKDSISDKNKNSSGTPAEDARLELIFKQLHLVYG